MFAIATNACAHDSEIISCTLASWLRVFGNRLDRVHVIVDGRPASGRIAANRAHVQADPSRLWDVLAHLAQSDSRVHVSALGEIPQERSLSTWFTEGAPDRCQAGTPIRAFVAAFEAPDAEFVLRADCDMLFWENGWLAEGMRLLRKGQTDLVEPPRLGHAAGGGGGRISTRALMLRPSVFHQRCLPIVPHRLGLVRRIHRRLHGRPTWLALEQMLEVERRRGGIRHVILDNAMGYSVHIDQRSFPSREWLEGVVGRIEAGDVTPAQRRLGWNFSTEAWPEAA
ncbi:MAG: hypothetical protein P8Z30_15200 [Acidobacteriota bacterium]